MKEETEALYKHRWEIRFIANGVRHHSFYFYSEREALSAWNKVKFPDMSNDWNILFIRYDSTIVANKVRNGGVVKKRRRTIKKG